MQTLCGSWFSAGQACGAKGAGGKPSKQRRRGSSLEGDGWGATVSVGGSFAGHRSLADRVAVDRFEDGDVIIDRHGMRVRGLRLQPPAGEDRPLGSSHEAVGHGASKTRTLDGEGGWKQTLSAGPEGLGCEPQSCRSLDPALLATVRDDDDLSIASTTSRTSKSDKHAPSSEAHDHARAASRSKALAIERNSSDDGHIETWVRTGKTSPRRQIGAKPPPPIPASLAKARARGMPLTQAEKVMEQYSTEDIVPMLRKVRPLGRGNGGVVWQATFEDGRHSLPIALKQVPLAEDEDKRAMVVHEMRTMTDVKHPCVVLCHKVFFSNSTFNMVMELVKGGSLLDLMKSADECIPMDAIGAVCSSLLRALDHLHTQHRVMHRDVKPGNILISVDGSVKLADLGVCSKPGELPSKQWVGTVTYMSPERMTGDEYTFSSDIWSAGLVAAEAALGSYPFLVMAQTKNPAAQLEFWDLLDLLVSGEGTTGDLLRDECPGAGEDMVGWVEACMHRDDELRPSAAAALEMPWIAGASEARQREALSGWVQGAVRVFQQQRGDPHEVCGLRACGAPERACGAGGGDRDGGDRPSTLQGVVDSFASLFV